MKYAFFGSEIVICSGYIPAMFYPIPDDADDIREQALDAVRQLAPSVISKTQGYDPDSRLSRATLEFQVIA